MAVVLPAIAAPLRASTMAASVFAVLAPMVQRTDLRMLWSALVRQQDGGAPVAAGVWLTVVRPISKQQLQWARAAAMQQSLSNDALKAAKQQRLSSWRDRRIVKELTELSASADATCCHSVTAAAHK